MFSFVFDHECFSFSLGSQVYMLKIKKLNNSSLQIKVATFEKDLIKGLSTIVMERN